MPAPCQALCQGLRAGVQVKDVVPSPRELLGRRSVALPSVLRRGSGWQSD